MRPTIVNVSAAELAARIESDIRNAGRPERAANEQRYLKSELEHAGASVPAVRRIVNAELAAHGPLGHDELVALVRTLWASGLHECRMASVEVLEARTGTLEPDDIELVEHLLRESRTWALVDGLAANVAGELVERYPDLTGTLDRWATDEDFWLRRSALLALLHALRRGEGDFERFGRYADVMLEEREFFIRKAIGWVLRDASRRRPELVYAWLEPRATRASGVTIREAVKYLSPTQREQITERRSSPRA